MRNIYKAFLIASLLLGGFIANAEDTEPSTSIEAAAGQSAYANGGLIYVKGAGEYQVINIVTTNAVKGNSDGEAVIDVETGVYVVILENGSTTKVVVE